MKKRVCFSMLWTIGGVYLFFVGGPMDAISRQAEPAQPAKEQKTAEKAQPLNKLEELLGFPVHGSFSLRYRGRWTNDESDFDLYQYLGLDVGDPNKHTVTARFSGRSSQDLDGKRDRKGYYVYDSLADTYGNRVNARLYEAYVDLHRLDPTDRIRLGRQYLYEAPIVMHFDGAHVETQECISFYHAHAGVYGGVPVHLFESSPNGDSLLGAYLQGAPWNGGRIRGDWIHLRDHTFLGTERNDLFGISAWQSVSPYLHLYGMYTRLEEDDRDYLFRASFYKPDDKFQITASVYRLMQTQRAYALEFEPFYFSTAFEYRPYWHTRILASKELTEQISVEAGLDIREMDEEDDQGQFNHEFRRAHLSPTVLDWPVKGMRISVTGEIWDTPGSDNGDVQTVGADLSHQCSEYLNASIGTAYSLYKYDYYLNEERDHVRTYYVRAAYAWSKTLKLDAAYEYENDEFDEYHGLRFGARYTF